MKLKLACLAALLLPTLALADSYLAPTLDPAADGQRIGSIDRDGALFWGPEDKVVGFRNMEKIAPTRRVQASDSALALPVNLQDLGGLPLDLGAETMTLDEYFEAHHTAGLLVIKDGEILYERYGLGNTADSRWVSFSVAKSVVAMLIGAAVQDGYIDNVNEKVADYLPRLAGSPYSETSIKNLLQMASGLEWNEDYADPNSDVATASWETIELYDFLNGKARVAPAGERFNYNTAETNLAGTLLRAAIGNNLATYLESKVWGPFGMEADAYWQLTELAGGEFGGCCINATLRDYGRLGLFALADGVLADGTRVLPEGWMAASTAPSRGYEGYGYFWWLNADGTYNASGIFGQGIHINAEKNLVIAVHSAWEHAGRGEDFNRLDAVYAAIAEHL